MTISLPPSDRLPLDTLKSLIPLPSVGSTSIRLASRHIADRWLDELKGSNEEARGSVCKVNLNKTGYTPTTRRIGELIGWKATTYEDFFDSVFNSAHKQVILYRGFFSGFGRFECSLSRKRKPRSDWVEYGVHVRSSWADFFLDGSWFKAWLIAAYLYQWASNHDLRAYVSLREDGAVLSYPTPTGNNPPPPLKEIPVPRTRYRVLEDDRRQRVEFRTGDLSRVIIAEAHRRQVPISPEIESYLEP